MNDFIAVIARYMGRAFAWGTGWWAMWGPGCLVTAGDQPGSGGTTNPVTGYQSLAVTHHRRPRDLRAVVIVVGWLGFGVGCPGMVRGMLGANVP